MSGSRRRRINSTEALARSLGLSRWTVSRVLNGHGGVSKKTEARVRALVRESGFEPSLYARTLRGGRTLTIGVCIQELDSPSLSKKVGRLQALFRKEGFRCLLELTGRNRVLEEQVLSRFLNLKVDGIVVIGSILSGNSPVFAELVQSGTPVSLVDPETDVDFPSVEVDRAGAMEKMLELLWKEQHRSFGLAGFDPEYPYSFQRLKGVELFLSRRKATKIWSLFEPGMVTHDYEYGERLGKMVLKEKKKPSAVVAVNDRVAIGLITHLRSAGVQIPGDLSVVGHDNLDVASFTEPKLTTVDQNIHLLMQAAVNGIIDGIEKRGKVPVRQVIPTEIVIRHSHLRKVSQ
ncbi:MAG: LacI family DNA-binding transcriptional regulator [Verrucomicrobiota bacterium]